MTAHVTYAEHEALKDRVDAHDVRLAVQDSNQAVLQKAVDAVVVELVKTRWTLIGFAFTVCAAAVGAVLGLK